LPFAFPAMAPSNQHESDRTHIFIACGRKGS